MDRLIESIKAEMRRVVKHWFAVGGLNVHAQAFVEEKLQQPVKFGLLTAVHNEGYGGEETAGVKAAAAVELFILASDIIDDLQDQDAPHYAWMKVPQAEAMHTAISLLTLSQQALMDSTPEADRQLRLTRMMNKQLLQAAIGQMSDIRNESDSEEAYLDVVRQKSAAIMVFACMTGVLLSGQPWCETTAKYAAELGISAQLRNDLRDLVRWDEKSDFVQRKRTLLTLYLLESDLTEAMWIQDYFERRIAFEEIRDKKEDFERVCERSGALLYGSVMSRLHYNHFEESLNESDFPYIFKQKLINLVD